MESRLSHANWFEELEVALRGLYQACAHEANASAGLADKLAYFAYTGKVELIVRDELAWALQRRREQKGIDGGSIGREYKRIDLVAFDGDEELEYLLQSKALYVGDLIPSGRWNSVPHQLLNELADDVHVKARDTSDKPTAGLLLVTDFPTPPSGLVSRLAYDGIVKRQRGMSVAGEDLRAQLSSLLKATVDSSGDPAPLELHGNGGAWCGTHNGNVRVHWYLVCAATSARRISSW